jgi:hypothetical protein
MQYAIRCTPGGLLRDDRTDNIITFKTYGEAETEAQRLTQAAYSIVAMQTDFMPVGVPEAGASEA